MICWASRTFPAGTDILTAEEPGDVAYIVLDGTVKVQVDRPDGTAVILAILRAGEVVGEMSLVDSLGRSATVVAMEQTTLAWLTHTDFWTCLRSMPTMAYNLAGILSRRLRLLERARRRPGDAGHRRPTCRSAPRAGRGVRRSHTRRWLPDPVSVDARRSGGVGRGFTGARQSDPGQLEAQQAPDRRRAAYRHPPQSRRIGRDGARPTRRTARGARCKAVNCAGGHADVRWRAPG